MDSETLRRTGGRSSGMDSVLLLPRCCASSAGGRKPPSGYRGRLRALSGDLRGVAKAC